MAGGIGEDEGIDHIAALGPRENPLFVAETAKFPHFSEKKT